MSDGGTSAGGPGWVSSVVALAVGIALSVSVSALLGALGWGGELASQTAGAASGAAPLLVDAVRHRRARRLLARGTGVPPGQRDWPRKLLLTGCFAFAVLVAESALGWFVWHLVTWTLRAAHAGQDRFQAVYALLGGLLVIPVVLLVLYLAALAAGRRLREHRGRWILLGLGIYAAVRLANLVVAHDELRTGPVSISDGVLVATVLVVLPLMGGVALLGVRRARRTQAAFDASVYFRRLEPADREAALALLYDAQPVRPTKPPSAGPGVAGEVLR